MPDAGGRAGDRPGPTSRLTARWRSVPALPVLCAVGAVLLPLVSRDGYVLRELSLIAVLTLLVSGLNITYGWLGELNFGQVFVFAVAAYGTMIVAGRGLTDVLLLLVLGGLLAAATGALLAAAALRLKGWALGLTTFFLVVTIPDVLAITESNTGGLNGYVDIPVPLLFGRPLGPQGLAGLTAVVTVAWLVAYRNVVTSHVGVALRSWRASPHLAMSLGLSPVRLTTTGYLLGSLPAGLAGCLFGFVSLAIGPSSFSITLTVGLVAASILGGRESVYGAVAAAALLQLGPQSSLRLQEYAPLAYGLFLVAVAIAVRAGGFSSWGYAAVAALRAARPASSQDGPALRTAGGTPGGRLGSDLVTLHGVELTMRGVQKAFHGVEALRGVDLCAQAGEITAIVGANGSGKTTLLNVICGYVRIPTPGVVLVGADALQNSAPHTVARGGVARTFQVPALPAGVSVVDVVASARYRADLPGLLPALLRTSRYRSARRRCQTGARALLDVFDLTHLADRPAAQLAAGEQRLVEVARAVYARPRVLLLDEPAAGLGAEEIERLSSALSAVAAAGATVVLVEHNLPFVTAVADVAHVLHRGVVIASTPAASLSSDPAVLASYLGGSATAPSEPTPAKSQAARPGVVRRATRGPAHLELSDVHARRGGLAVLRGMTLTLEPGCLQLVLGRNGVGKSTLLQTIAGDVRVDSGSVLLDGRDITRLAPHRRARAGLVLAADGGRLFQRRTVWENVELGTWASSADRRLRRQFGSEALSRFPALEARAQDRAGDLSGGLRQMLSVCQALAAGPRVLLLDEPTSGLAAPAAEELLHLVRSLADDGLAVLLVEQRAQDALRIADHVNVMDAGVVVVSGPPSQFTDRQQLMHTYSSGPQPRSADGLRS